MSTVLCNGANDGGEQGIIKLYISRMTPVCHLGKFLYQSCVNMPVGMGLLGACLGWNRACSRSLQPGSVAVVIVPDLARLIRQNRETRTGEQKNGTGAQRPCPSPCIPGRISLYSSMPVYEGHLQGASLHVRLVLQRGRTHKRTEPFPSTTILFYLWKRPDPRTPETVSPGLRSSSRSGFSDPSTNSAAWATPSLTLMG